KLFYTGKFRLISTLLYVFMGWIIVFAINPLVDSFDHTGLMWLLAGGVSYTLGAILYSIKRLPLNHAIFHLLVLIGSSCHFVAVYFYIA
ncbi:MAG: hemolysin III family protein, partial [Pseudohongiella sp.]|nr:hemolysin III family protein [Pseudohongiella sp.]